MAENQTDNKIHLDNGTPISILDEYAKIDQSEVFDITGVEIFKTGTWHGEKFTTKDLDDMVDAHDEIGGLLKPYLKLGHNGKQKLLSDDGQPAAGWVVKLYRKGEGLFADFKSLPKKIKTLIDNKAYGRISSEVFTNLKVQGKTFRRALKAVALLGADTPEVITLDDFINLYTANKNDYDNLKLYNIEDNNMPDENKYLSVIKDLEMKIAEYEISAEKTKEFKMELNQKDVEILEFKKNETVLNDKITDIESKNVELEDSIKETQFSANKAEVKTYLDKAVSDNKITPAQVDSFAKLVVNDELKTFSSDSFDNVKTIVDNSSTDINTETQSEKVEIETKAFSNKLTDDEMHEKITKYSKDNKVSYTEAYDIVSSEIGGN